jgi:signal transduction histidine kinase
VSTLRGRILFGAVLWTTGLVAALGISYPWLAWRGKSNHAIHVITLVHSPVMALHTMALLAVAIACMAAGFSLVRRAFSPFDALRRGLAEVRKGSEAALPGTYPGEVQPLVDELNALLEHTKRTVERATAKAGDLAHGLKTPLAVLSNEADRLRSGGNVELADMLAREVALMRRQIEWHLAHARAAASGTALHERSPTAESVDGLRRVLERLHASRGVVIESRVSPDHAFQGRREDLDEMLGNLLDNACQWARSRVAVASRVQGGRLSLTVDDDGPGIPPELCERVLRRGVRADEAAPGSGLGLAIVRELAELYGGEIALGASPEGGLRARLELPGETASPST